MATRLFDLLKRSRISLCGLKADFSLVDELMEIEPKLDPTDALIVASAYGCPRGKIFYTTDGVLLESKPIHDRVRRKIKISTF